MLSNFKKHIETQFHSLQQARLLIAVSGGIDSMVLVDLCNQLKLNFAIAHCNFKLRGIHSDADEKFILETAEKINKKAFVKHFKTEVYAREHHLSIQMAARNLRYDWFFELSNSLNFDYILTAHHADDKLETFLINLSRGSGLEGLTGIPERNKNVIRPMLNFSRSEIETYAISNSIEWREDQSNTDIKYLRNKIRHEIVPKLKELHPQFLDNFMKTQQYLDGSSKIIAEEIKELKSILFNKEEEIIKIPIGQLKGLLPLKAYIYELFKDFGFTEWNDVIKLLDANSGKQIISATHRMLKDRSFILIDKIKTDDHDTKKEFLIQESDHQITEPLSLSFEPTKTIDEKNKRVIYLDKEKLNFPLIVRKWVKGDYFYPFGLKGKKKLSKFFKDEKVSLIAKERQWLLCSGNDIVWVIGKRADERFKVTSQTDQILKVKIEK